MSDVSQILQEYHIVYLLEISSTNDYINENLLQLPNKTCVWANVQTKGRGRGDHVWKSRADIDLTVSVLYVFAKDYSLMALSVLVALAIHNLYKHFGITTYLKWTNDVYTLFDSFAAADCDFLKNSAKIIDKYIKLSGILIETRVLGEFQYAIIGVGLDNIIQQDRNLVLSILLQELDQLIAEFTGNIDKNRQGLSAKLIEVWLSHCMHYQKRLQIFDNATQELYSGTHTGLTSEGFLLFSSDDNKTHKIYDGRITHINF